MNYELYKCFQTELWINTPGSQLNRCIAEAALSANPTIGLSLLAAGVLAYFCFIWLPSGSGKPRRKP